MRFASPLAQGKCLLFPSTQRASPSVSGFFSRSIKVPGRRKQPPRRHLQLATSAAAATPLDGLDLDSLDLLDLESRIDRSRFPLLTAPHSPVSHFVNLTNGLEAVPTLLALGIRDFTLIRLTSTACEQKRHADFLNEVDASLLAALSAGRVALVWDTSSRERGGRGEREEGDDDDDKEWKEALLSDNGGGVSGDGERGESVSRAGGGLRVPRALFWGLEFLRYACESRWNDADAAATTKEEEAEGGGTAGAAAAATTTTSPPPPSPKAFLGESGHDVTLDFEQALRKEVPDRTKARLRYFRRFYHHHQQQQQQLLQLQQQQQQGTEKAREREKGREEGAGQGGGRSSFDDGEEGIRLWGCYRPSKYDRGGGDEASRRAQGELFDLAFSSGAKGAGGQSAEEDPPPASPPVPRFSREAVALELASLGWGLFSGGADRAERLRASRRRREGKEGEK